MASTIELLNFASNSFLNNAPTALLYQTSAWSTPNATTGLTVPWNASSYDNWNGHSNSTNNTRYTIQVAGLYSMAACVTWSANATGVRIIEAYKNGSMLVGSEVYNSTVSGTYQTSVILPPYLTQCAVGDYLEINGYQNSGGTLATVTTSCYFSVEFIHF